jgi:hypothetical protein
VFFAQNDKIYNFSVSCVRVSCVRIAFDVGYVCAHVLNHIAADVMLVLALFLQKGKGEIGKRTELLLWSIYLRFSGRRTF